MIKKLVKDNTNYGDMAWKLNEIISHMNDEGAYYNSAWLYIWPDGEDYEGCCADFGNKESYEDLEKTFKSVYKSYHKGGLYNVSEETLKLANEWDDKLGLPHIADVKNGPTPDYNDNFEKEIIDLLNENKIYFDEIEEEYDEGAEDKPYKVIYFYESSSNAKKAFNLLKDKYTTVRYYRDFDGDQVLVSNFTYED